MAPQFVDTNIVIRYLTQDNPDQSKRSYQFLQRIQSGQLIATTSESVVVEMVQVLSSKALYNLPRPTIRQRLLPILRLRGLRVPQKRRVMRALDLYVAHRFLDFVDALSAAQVEQTQGMRIVSFDRDFDRVPGVVRDEP